MQLLLLFIRRGWTRKKECSKKGNKIKTNLRGNSLSLLCKCNLNYFLILAPRFQLISFALQVLLIHLLPMVVHSPLLSSFKGIFIKLSEYCWVEDISDFTPSFFLSLCAWDHIRIVVNCTRSMPIISFQQQHTKKERKKRFI